jgi:hypothetical protein
MKSSKKKKGTLRALQEKLADLEEKAAQKGIQIHYDLLEAAGLKLKDGICKIRGEYHLFINKRKSIPDKIETLKDYIDHPLPGDIPENITGDALEGSDGDHGQSQEMPPQDEEDEQKI